MSEKKRKSASTEQEKPNKKQQTTSNVTVKHISSTDGAKPIIASSPGVTFPSGIGFQQYAKKSQDGASRILLHSSEHSTIDYTASEEASSNDKLLKHYVAVFDPATGKLEVTEARRVTVRSSVRIAQPARDEDEEEIRDVSNYSSRAALTAAFGTKKSKKAVQSIAENRLLAQGNDDDDDNPVSAAMLSNLPDEDPEAIDAAVQTETRLSKPLPQANLNTGDVDQVYSLDTLVHPAPASATLAVMPIGVWVARISAKKEVLSTSRFIARRVGYMAQHLLNSPDASDPKITQQLQILRYIQLLLELHNYLIRIPRARAVGPVSTWPDKTFAPDTPLNLINAIVRHFLPVRSPTTFAMTLLKTTILALTLHIPMPGMLDNPNPNKLATELMDIQLDMALDPTEVKKLFRELGCRVEPATDAELNVWKMPRTKDKRKREDGGTVPRVVYAKLTLPLQFKKVSKGAPAKRR